MHSTYKNLAVKWRWTSRAKKCKKISNYIWRGIWEVWRWGWGSFSIIRSGWPGTFRYLKPQKPHAHTHTHTHRLRRWGDVFSTAIVVNFARLPGNFAPETETRSTWLVLANVSVCVRPSVCVCVCARMWPRWYVSIYSWVMGAHK